MRIPTQKVKSRLIYFHLLVLSVITVYKGKRHAVARLVRVSIAVGKGSGIRASIFGHQPVVSKVEQRKRLLLGLQLCVYRR